jgi:hypothetical protein
MSQPTRRTRILSAVAIGALALATLAGPATSATAGTNGKWTEITSPIATLNNFDTADLLRLSDGSLLVGWQEQDAGILESAQTAVIAGPKKLVTKRGTVASGWSTLSYSPKFAVANGQIVAGYLGIHSADTNDLASGPVLASRGVDGVTWAPDSLPISGDGADGIYGFDLVSDGVNTYTAAIHTSTNIIKYHKGSAVDYVTDDNLAVVSAPEGANVYYVSLAVDRATGEVWSAWYVLGGPTPGIWTQRIFPTQGPAVQPPGATGETVLPDKAIALTSSSSGGIWVGYPVGYPTATKIRAWSPLTGKSVTIASKQSDVSSVDLSAGPAGKLWATWIDSSSGDERVKAARSNPSKTVFGSIGSVRSLTVKGGGSTFNVTGEGSLNALDVVVNATMPGDSGETALYHSEIRPELTVTASKSKVSAKKGGSVKITVKDAGTAVKGAKVTYAGKKYTTSSKGTVVVKVKKGAKVGKKSISVKATGYEPTLVKLTVKK